MQALQQVFKQEVSNGRTRCCQLQEALHQRSTDLEAVKAQLAAAQQDGAAAVAEQCRLQQQLQKAQHSNHVLREQYDKVSSGDPCWAYMTGSSWQLPAGARISG